MPIDVVTHSSWIVRDFIPFTKRLTHSPTDAIRGNSTWKCRFTYKAMSQSTFDTEIRLTALILTTVNLTPASFIIFNEVKVDTGSALLVLLLP